MIEVVLQVDPNGSSALDPEATFIDGAPPTIEQWSSLDSLGPWVALKLNGASDEEIREALGDGLGAVARAMEALGILDGAQMRLRAVAVEAVSARGAATRLSRDD